MRPPARETDDAEAQRVAKEARRAGGRGGPHGAMGVPTEKSLDFGASARRLLGRLAPVRARVLAAVTLTVVGVTLMVMGPAVLGRATDLLFAGVVGARLPAGASKDGVVADLRARGETSMADMLAAMEVVPGQGVRFDLVAQTLLLALALYAASSLFTWWAGRIVNDVAMRTMRRLRDDVEDKLHRLPLGFVDSQPRGELLSRVTNDIDNLGQSLQQTLGQMLNSLVTVVGILAVMVWVSPLLTVVTLLTIPVSLVALELIRRRSQRMFVRQWRATGVFNGQVEEAFTGHELVTTFGRREEAVQAALRTNEELHDAAFGAQVVSGLMFPAMMFVGNVSYVLIAVVGGLQVASGGMTLGAVQAFIQYSRQFTQPLSQVASMVALLQSGVASAERVFELLDAPEQSPENTGAALPERTRGRIEFHDVSFRYDPDRPLIEHLDLVAEPGQTVAIVGPTGAGKTTLVNLVMRFYEVDSGRITLDGVDITEMSRQQLRSRIGMVLQDTWMFKGTIAENIAYGRPGASEDDIRAAAEATYVDRFVQHLPDGYDTVLDDDGGNVSAGEKQLITIARAFLSQPSLLILDEATSSVDTRTEFLLQHAMAALRSDRTSFVIAHRLSTIRDADLVLVMDGGRIVEQGAPEDLLRAGGAYARLYAAQFAGEDT